MAERSDLQQSLLQTLPRRNSAAAIDCDIDVVLTTFSYFSGSKTDDRAFLRRFDYHYMVVDEAHCLKNPDANVYQNLDKLGTEHRILLTGTPGKNIVAARDKLVPQSLISAVDVMGSSKLAKRAHVLDLLSDAPLQTHGRRMG
jgi:SWI/SNF-related matrix-associated actin-dependent regulator 1 of chromatin subfamily A